MTQCSSHGVSQPGVASWALSFSALVLQPQQPSTHNSQQGCPLVTLCIYLHEFHLRFRQDSPIKSLHSSLQPVPILNAINNCAPSADSPNEVLSPFSRSFITTLRCTSASTDTRTPLVTSRLLWDPARTPTLCPLSLNPLLSLIYPTNGFRNWLNSIRFPSLLHSWRCSLVHDLLILFWAV